jgi:uncharacterized membrane protein YkvI
MRRLLPWVLSILFLIAVVFVVATSSTFQSCLKKEQYNSANQHLQGGPAEIVLIYRHCVGGFVHDNAEGIIAIFTIILALSTIFLWAVTRDLAKSSERAITELSGPTYSSWITIGFLRKKLRPMTLSMGGFIT